MKSVAFSTLGCKVNQYETEAIREKFVSAGYQVVDSNDIADIYIINTCSVTNLSERKSRQVIRSCKNTNNDAIIAVVGCYSQISSDEVFAMDEVDIVLGTKDKLSVFELCEEFIETNQKINKVYDNKNDDTFEDMSINQIEDKTRANIKIQDGCNQFCSYCIIPYARGVIRSKDLNDIYEETKKLAESGYKEVVLTGIHVASYGKDKGDISLIDAIETCASVEGIQRIRLSSIEQGALTDDFLERALKTNKLCHHFHLSLQSGSDSVLKRMNRKYNTSEYSDTVDRIRKYIPDVGITTDIIVGFPEETDEEFLETVEFCKKIGFSKIHIFKYSPRKGTKAISMKQVDGDIKIKRAKILEDLEEKLRFSFLDSFIGKELEILPEQQNSDGLFTGYSSNYIKVESKLDYNKFNILTKVYISERINDKLLGIYANK